MSGIITIAVSLTKEPNGELAEEAVFAISQLPGDSGTQMLLDLAMDEQIPREIRRQALLSHLIPNQPKF
jgi:hypothetical protein